MGSPRIEKVTRNVTRKPTNHYRACSMSESLSNWLQCKAARLYKHNKILLDSIPIEWEWGFILIVKKNGKILPESTFPTNLPANWKNCAQKPGIWTFDLVSKLFLRTQNNFENRDKSFLWVEAIRLLPPTVLENAAHSPHLFRNQFVLVTKKNESKECEVR